MSSVSFQCRYCGGASEIPAGRIFNTLVIRCDRCQALSAISEPERRELLAQQTPAASSPRPPAVMRSLR